MELQHFNVKLFVTDPTKLELHQFNPIFQRWIQEKTTEDLLIDVADYIHIPEGPGMVLVGLEVDYAMDNTHGRWGLKYNRKAKLDGSNQDRLRSALKATLEACQRLEKDPTLKGKVSFRSDEIEIFINDRALAPNKPETWSQHQASFEEVLQQLYGGDSFEVEVEKDPRERFGIRVTCSRAPGIAEMIQNLS